VFCEKKRIAWDYLRYYFSLFYWQQAAAAPAREGPTGKVMIYTSIYPDIIELMKPSIKKQFPDFEVQWFPLVEQFPGSNRCSSCATVIEGLVTLGGDTPSIGIALVLIITFSGEFGLNLYATLLMSMQLEIK